MLKQLSFKRKDLGESTRNLRNHSRSKWLKKHDTTTLTAKTSLARGAFIGKSKPLRIPLQIGSPSAQEGNIF